MIIPVWIVMWDGCPPYVLLTKPDTFDSPKRRIYRADIEVPDPSDATAIMVKAGEVEG